MLEGQDLGELPQRFWGDSDYEYWVVVQAEHKPAVLAALRRDVPPGEGDDAELLQWMARVLGGDSKAVSHFRDLLQAHGIPSEFGNWA